MNEDETNRIFEHANAIAEGRMKARSLKERAFAQYLATHGLGSDGALERALHASERGSK